MDIVETKDAVRHRYDRFAERGGNREACCGQAEAQPCCGYAVGEGLYSDTDLAMVPDGALDLSRGCGNPTGFADLRAGEVAVDLGCGGGMDVILAARKVGPDGLVIGIDFAPTMIERARENVAKAGLAERVKLRAEDIAETGLADGVADVIISNCIINLCPDKDAVYREAYRVLRPGGRLAISDIIFTEPIPADLQERFRSVAAGCLAWAIPEAIYLDMVRASGFDDLKVVACHRLGPEEVQAMARCPGAEFSPPVNDRDLGAVFGKMASCKFTAGKPV